MVVAGAVQAWLTTGVVPDLTPMLAAMTAGLGLVAARDNEKSSEDVGAGGKTGGCRLYELGTGRSHLAKLLFDRSVGMRANCRRQGRDGEEEPRTIADHAKVSPQVYPVVSLPGGLVPMGGWL